MYAIRSYYEPRVIAIQPAAGSSDELLEIAAAIEAESTHPLAIGSYNFV